MIFAKHLMKCHINEISEKKAHTGKLLQSSSWRKVTISLGIATHEKESQMKDRSGG